MTKTETGFTTGLQKQFSIQIFQTMCMNISLALALLRGFFSGFSGFPPLWKNNTTNSNSTRLEEPYENQLKLM